MKEIKRNTKDIGSHLCCRPPSWCPFKLIQTIELSHKYWALGGTLPVWWFENSIQSDNVGSVNVCSFSPGIFLVWLWPMPALITNNSTATSWNLEILYWEWVPHSDNFVPGSPVWSGNLSDSVEMHFFISLIKFDVRVFWEKVYWKCVFSLYKSLILDWNWSELIRVLL